MSNLNILAGSCLDIPADAWGADLQAMITDPPYSEHVHANITSAGTRGEGSRGWHRQTLGFDALGDALRVHIATVAARVQGWAVIYSDFESASVWREACAAALSEYVRSVPVLDERGAPSGYDGVLPWVRWSQPQKSGDRPPQGFEILTLCWGRAHSRKAWNGPGQLTALSHKSLRGEDKHRTEKPLDQALDLVSWFSNAPHLPWGPSPHGPGVPGYTAQPAQAAHLPVYDPCLGSGTTAVACALLGRAFVGHELDPVWAAAALERAEGAAAGRLSARDLERATRWIEATIARAEATPEPKAADGSDVKTWERAQRQIADAMYVAERIG